jgi:hypothetical protein
MRFPLDGSLNSGRESEWANLPVYLHKALIKIQFSFANNLTIGYSQIHGTQKQSRKRVGQAQRSRKNQAMGQTRICFQDA